MGPRVYKSGDIFSHRERNEHIMLLKRSHPDGRWHVLDLGSGVSSVDVSEGVLFHLYAQVG